MPARFDILFVDATDTLLRVHGSVGQLYAVAARRHEFEAPAETIDRSFRAAMATAPPACFPGEDPAALERRERRWWHDVVSRTFAPLGRFDRFEPFFDEVFEMFRTTAAWDLLPDARETLETLHARGLRLGIVSDMDARLLDVLEHLGIRALFEPVVLSTRAGASKRDGGLFPIALDRAGVAAARAAHVGDSLTADVAGARSAGITPIWLDIRRDGGAPAGVATAHAWCEIPAVLEALEHGARP
jgi:putative hydrolase of the HAD superfamily